MKCSNNEYDEKENKHFCSRHNSECNKTWDCPEYWLNKTFHGGIHKNLMIMENAFGIPDTEVKKEMYLQTSVLGLRGGNCNENT